MVKRSKVKVRRSQSAKRLSSGRRELRALSIAQPIISVDIVSAGVMAYSDYVTLSGDHLLICSLVIIMFSYYWVFLHFNSCFTIYTDIHETATDGLRIFQYGLLIRTFLYQFFTVFH